MSLQGGSEQIILNVGAVVLLMHHLVICMVSSFWKGVITCIDFVLGQYLIFIDAYVLLNHIPASWMLTTGQHRWTLHALTTGKKTHCTQTDFATSERQMPAINNPVDRRPYIIISIWCTDGNYTWIYFLIFRNILYKSTYRHICILLFFVFLCFPLFSFFFLSFPFTFAIL